MDATNGVNQDDVWDAVSQGNIDTLKQIWTADLSLLYKCKVGCFDQSILHVVASHGYVEYVNNILTHDKELAEVVDSRQWSPLHVAAAKGHMAVLEELLPYSQHVARVKTIHGETILHLCIKHNRLEPLKRLIEYTNDSDFANHKDPEGNTILHLAVLRSYEPIVRYLLGEKIVDMCSRNANGNTALDIAYQNKRVEGTDTIENLLRMVANQDDLWDAVAKGKINQDAIWYAMTQGNNIDTLKQIWRADLSVLYKCKVGYFDQSILNVVASHGNVEAVNDILNLDPELAEVLDSRQWSPLHMAAAKGHMTVLEELLPYSQHVARVKTIHGETILHLCIKHNRLEPLKRLIEYTNDSDFANHKDPEGNTILHLAVLRSYEPIVRYLLGEKIVDMCSRNANGNTALDIAYQNKRVGGTDTIENLLRMVANQDDLWDAVAKGKINQDAVWYAMTQGNNIDTLKQIWRADLSVLYKCKVGYFDQSILNVVASHGNVEAVNDILNLDPKLAEVLDSRQWSPLHVAAANGHMTVLEALLPHSHHVVRVKTIHGETILHLCIKHNRLEPLIRLIEYTKDSEFANHKDHVGNTILHLAVLHRYEPCVKYILEAMIVDIFSRNANGNTPSDIVYINKHVEGMDIIESHLRNLGAVKSGYINYIIRGQWLTEKRGSLMVVASLMATVAFQAAVNPPGGVWQDNLNGHRAGNSIMQGDITYTFFGCTNTVGFVGSLALIIFLLLGPKLKTKSTYMLPFLITAAVTIYALLCTYSFAVFLTTPYKKRKYITKSFFAMFGILSAALITLMFLLVRRLVLRPTHQPADSAANV